MRRAIWSVVTVFTIVTLDLLSKSWALRALVGGEPRELFGGLVPLQLHYNRGAAFGITIGDDPRWFFIPMTIVAFGFLIYVIRSAAGDPFRVGAASLVLGGAVGNFYDRVRWDTGVVDFIGPIDLYFTHFPVFNVADMAITCGGIALAISFWREDTKIERSAEGREGVKAGVSEG
jgi:signal peptidase II